MQLKDFNLLLNSAIIVIVVEKLQNTRFSTGEKCTLQN